MFSIDKKQFYVFIIPLLFMVGMLIAVAAVVNNTKQEARTGGGSSVVDDLSDETVDANCPISKSYCVLSYHDKKYLVTNKDYAKDHEIAYFTVTKTDTSNIKAFSNYTYDEYEEFCKTYGIEQNFHDSTKRYIVYFNNSNLTAPTSDYRVYNSLFARLSDVKYKNGKVYLYIWEKITDLGGIYPVTGEPRTKAYVAIIPTTENTQEYVIRPLMHRTEYNKIAGLNPMAGYSYNIADNLTLAEDIEIYTKNDQFNTIVKNSIKAIASERTVKVTTTRNGFTQNLESYLDLTNSVYKIQTGTQAVHYTAYTNDLALHYSLYGAEAHASATSSVVDRSAVLKDVLREFSDIDIFSENPDYRISIAKDSDSYTIKLTQSANTDNKTKLSTTIYFNKRTYLPIKIVNSSSTNTFDYTKDSVTLPDDIDRDSYAATIN